MYKNVIYIYITFLYLTFHGVQINQESVPSMRNMAIGKYAVCASIEYYINIKMIRRMVRSPQDA